MLKDWRIFRGQFLFNLLDTGIKRVEFLRKVVVTEEHVPNVIERERERKAEGHQDHLSP